MTAQPDDVVIHEKVDFVVATHEGIALPADMLSTPGEVLKEELEARGWTQKDLADIMGRPAQVISEIINGAKQITPDTAMELGAALGQPPEFWMRLEANYRLALAQDTHSNDAIARRARMYALAPVGELLRRQWLPSRASAEPDLCRFLGIAAIWDEPVVPASLRASIHRGPELGVITAWLRRVEWLASQQRVADYDPEGLIVALPDVAAMSVDPANVADLPARLAALGVHFVVVPHLSKTYLDGASMWVEGHPVVAVTIRYDRVDSFWFTVMHELAHIALGHIETIPEGLDNGLADDPREGAANRMASDLLIDPTVYERVVAATKASDSTYAAVAAAAGSLRHPGIFVGRLQHDGILGFERGRTHLAKVRVFLRDRSDRVAAA